jgi:protein-arginine kinase activator protein McsA
MFTCEGCGAVLQGRRARKFCSNACQRSAERDQRIAAWLQSGEATHAGTTPGHYIRRYILDGQGGLCAICALPSEWHGLPLTLVLDHIDGDAANNRRENLRLVCPNCDSQLSTYKSRNRGRGRAWRRERYANGKSY